MKLSIKGVSGQRRTSYQETSGETERVKGITGKRTLYSETSGDRFASFSIKLIPL